MAALDRFHCTDYDCTYSLMVDIVSRPVSGVHSSYTIRY